jgi:hypothetical protein
VSGCFPNHDNKCVGLIFATYNWIGRIYGGLFCSGNPLLFEAFWRANPDLGTAVIPGWYRLGYLPKPGAETFYNDAFIDAVRGMHTLVGNAVTEGRYILVGTGSMQLVNAVVHSLALQNPETVSPVVARAPYYSVRILHGCPVYTTRLPITCWSFFIDYVAIIFRNPCERIFHFSKVSHRIH